MNEYFYDWMRDGERRIQDVWNVRIETRQNVAAGAIEDACRAVYKNSEEMAEALRSRFDAEEVDITGWLGSARFRTSIARKNILGPG